MKRTEGFTLIEVMVATTILLMMTVMMGALFRQATSAWDAGNVQAEGGMIVRGVVGAITRDLATAVDARAYGESAAFTCSGNTLEFVCLKPPGKVGTTSVGVPHKIKYNVGTTVKRTDKVRNAAGAWIDNGQQPTTLYDGNGSDFYSAKFSLEALSMPDKRTTNPNSSDSDRSDFEDDDFVWNGPPSVKVTLKLTQDGSFSGLSVRSRGPNGIPGAEDGGDDDDIVVK